MADMLSFVPFARYGINSTPSLRTGTPTAYKWVPFFQNGFGLVETITSEDLATVHQYQGTRYTIFTGRNDQKGTINMPIMPENASTFFGAATTLTAGQPSYGTWEFYWPTVLAASWDSSVHYGIQMSGAICDGFSVSWSRLQPSALQFGMEFFMSYATKLVATTKTISASTNAVPAEVTTSAAHGLVPGDVVTISGADVSSLNGTWVVSNHSTTTKFEIDNTTAPGGTATTGTVSKNYPAMDVAKTHTITTCTNATTCVVTCPNHTFAVGDTVVVASVGGATGLNGTRVVTAISATTFTVVLASTPGVYTSGGTVQRIYGAGMTPYQKPFQSAFTLVDIDFADSSGTYAGWSGDQADLRSLQIQYGNGVTVDTKVVSATAEQNLAWTRAYGGNPTLTVSGSFTVSSSKYIDLLRVSELRDARMRFAMYGNSPSGNTTSTSNLTAGSSVAITVASSSGFAVGDYVLIWQPTAAKFAVAKITIVTDSTHFTVDTLDVSMNGGTETLTIRNSACEIKVSNMKIKGGDGPKPDGNVMVKDFTASANLVAGNASIVTIKAYDDDDK